jgi:hypothetical protein
LTRAQIIWTGPEPPTRAELRAIGAAWRAGQIPDGARVGCASEAELERLNPAADLEAARGRVAKLKYDLRRERVQARERTARLRARRDASRPKLQAQIGRFRGRWRAEVNERVQAWRDAHAAIWRARIAAARVPVLDVQNQLEAERESEARIRRERASRKKKAGPARRAGAIRKAESDYEVEGNIDPDLVPVWHRVKNRIRTAGSRASRTEAFLEWVAENRREVDRMLSDMAAQAEDELGDELAAQEAAHYQGVAA